MDRRLTPIYTPIDKSSFSKPSNYEAELAELIRKLRGERPKRGGWRSNAKLTTAKADTGAEAADDVQEVLVSNLLSVEVLPTTIWSDAATTQSRTDVWKTLTGKRVPPFLLADGRLYSFFGPNADVVRMRISAEQKEALTIAAARDELELSAWLTAGGFPGCRAPTREQGGLA